MEKPDEKVKDSSGSKESMTDAAVKHVADADVQAGPDSASIKDQVTESTNESKVKPEEEEDEGTRYVSCLVRACGLKLIEIDMFLLVFSDKKVHPVTQTQNSKT